MFELDIRYQIRLLVDVVGRHKQWQQNVTFYIYNHQINIKIIWYVASGIQYL